MKKIDIKNFRTLDDLIKENYKTKEDIEYFIKVAYEDYCEDDDQGMFLNALRMAVQMNKNIGGMTELSKKTGLNRESLYKMLSPKGNPTFANVNKVMNALGYTFQIKAA